MCNIVSKAEGEHVEFRLDLYTKGRKTCPGPTCTYTIVQNFTPIGAAVAEISDRPICNRTEKKQQPIYASIQY